MPRLVAELHAQFAESAKAGAVHQSKPERRWVMAGDSRRSRIARHLADFCVEELPFDWDVVTLGDLFTKGRGLRAASVVYPREHLTTPMDVLDLIRCLPDFRRRLRGHQQAEAGVPNQQGHVLTSIDRIGTVEGGELLMSHGWQRRPM